MHPPHPSLNKVNENQIYHLSLLLLTCICFSLYDIKYEIPFDE